MLFKYSLTLSVPHYMHSTCIPFFCVICFMPVPPLYKDIVKGAYPTMNHCLAINFNM